MQEQTIAAKKFATGGILVAAPALSVAVPAAGNASPSPPLSRLGGVASTNPTIPPAAPATSPQFSESQAAPLQIYIGDATLTPASFVDFTSVFRSTAIGNGIGTNFGGIPFGNTLKKEKKGIDRELDIR